MLFILLVWPVPHNESLRGIPLRENCRGSTYLRGWGLEYGGGWEGWMVVVGRGEL